MRAPVRFGLAAAVMALAACTVQADSSGNLELVGLSAQTRSADDFRWQGTLAPGQTVEIKGVNGSIEAGPSTSGQIEVLARRAGRRSDPESVTIEVVPHPGGVTICAVYPSPDGRPNECAPGGNGRMNTRDNDVKVDFTVSVPTGLVFAGRTVNGSVRADGLDNNLSLETVNGGVTFSTTGYASASTVNGSIRGALGRADWTDDLEFQTVNGSITLDLPESLSTDVEARTVNGAISTDFPLTVSGRFSNRRLSGVIGGGGRRLSLETVNGGITLRRR
jgi:hypothetical protein